MIAPACFLSLYQSHHRKEMPEYKVLLYHSPASLKKERRRPGRSVFMGEQIEEKTYTRHFEELGVETESFTSEHLNTSNQITHYTCTIPHTDHIEQRYIVDGAD